MRIACTVLVALFVLYGCGTSSQGPVHHLADDFANAFRHQDTRAISDIWQKLFPERFLEEPKSDEMLAEWMGSSELVSVHAGASERFNRDTVTPLAIRARTKSSGEVRTVTFYVLSDASGEIIRAFADLEILKFWRRVEFLRDASSIAVDFKLSDEWVHQTTYGREAVEEIVNALLYRGPAKTSIGRTKCPFSVRLRFQRNGADETVLLGTDGCGQYHFDGCQCQGTFHKNEFMEGLLGGYEKQLKKTRD